MSEGREVQAEYPKVLLVNCEPIGRRCATGITMGNLFKGWPRGRLAQVYYADSEPDTEICEQSWKLNLEDLMMPQWLRERVVSEMQRKGGRDSQGEASIVTSPKPTRWAKARRNALLPLKHAFFTVMEFSGYRISPALRAWVRAFEPDVIYSVLGNLHLVRLAEQLAALESIRVIPHFMDDWLVSKHRGGPIQMALRHELEAITSRVMRNAPTRMVISEAMAREYERRYGLAFVPFMNCVELDGLQRPVRNRSLHGDFRFVFAGGLHLGRAHLLVDIGVALSELASRGTKAFIDVYSSNLSREDAALLSAHKQVRLCGEIPVDRVREAIANADGLLHLESFERRVMLYTRFSMSTKIPEYLASGTGIFAYGPEDQASIRYLVANECGMAVVERKRRELVNGLQRFIEDDSLRRELEVNARNLYVRNHEARAQRSEFRKMLASPQCGELHGCGLD